MPSTKPKLSGWSLRYITAKKRGASLPAWMLAVAQVHATLSVEAAIRGEQ